MVADIIEYKSKVQELTHVAVRRSKGVLDYSHHYLVLFVDLDEYVLIIHYTPGKNAFKVGSLVRVTLEKLRFDSTDSDLLDFSSGLFFITKQNYPSNVSEIVAAYTRAKSRIGETNYSPSSNNCESFVTWVLTGESTCDQVEESGTGKRMLMDAVDGGLDHGKKVIRNGQSDLPCRVSANTMAHAITNSGDKLAIIATAAKTSATAASKVGPSAIAAGVSTGITAAFAIPIEATFCALEIRELKKQKKAGTIKKKDFKRQVTKKVSGSVSSVTVATGSSFLGAFVGQIVCPIPVLGGVIGGVIGGVLGSVAGRASGSVVSGKVFDKVTDKK